MAEDLTLEPGEDLEPSRCSCCGTITHRVFGFVYRAGNAHSVYHASWTPAHPDRGANVALEFGDWSEGARPSDRFETALEIRPTASDYEFEFLEPADSAWAKSGKTRMLSRAEALAHPDRGQFLLVARHVLFGDRRLKDGIDRAAAV